MAHFEHGARNTFMRIAHLTRFATDVATGTDERADRSTISVAVPASEARTRPADLELGAAWHETVQAAARLKLVLGTKGSVVAVTGVEVEDRASLLTARLAAAMAHIDHSRVVAIDGNVASPRLGERFHLSSGPGLLDVLERRTELKSAIRSSTPDNL